MLIDLDDIDDGWTDVAIIRIRVPAIHRPQSDPDAPDDAICLCRQGFAIEPLGDWLWSSRDLLRGLAQVAETIADDGLREAATLEAQVATTRRGTGPAGRTS